jgi:hypothetical protein
VNKPPNREASFISHANPGDNAFVRWLGAKLTAMGYEVWADVMRLHGGSDWSRELEEALRTRAIKMLLVCTPAGLDKQGVRNEIEIASQLAAELKDREFIIPLRLERYRPPFRIAQAQYVDFSRGWAAGLTELVDLLINIHKSPRRSGQSMEEWLIAQSIGATRLIEHPERLTANWLIFRRLPQLIRYCEPRSGFSIERFQNKTLHQWPVIPFNSGVVTFASPDRDGLIAANMPARIVYELPVRSFLDVGWEQLKIPVYETRRQFSDLGNQAFENFLESRGLTSNERTRDRHVWWGNIRTFPLTQVRFDWPRQSGRRQIIGVSAKRQMHWH